ncbi:MAG: AI-2E family transporter [Chloroflexi bacterium]|nr:AI-2E family transporter [Chloroflexota bacterium]
MQQKKQEFHTRNFFYALLIGAIYLAYLLVKPYGGVILFALVAVIVFRPVYIAFFRLAYGRASIAITLTFLLMFLVVLLPALWIGQTLIQQLTQVINESNITEMSQSELANRTLTLINDFIEPFPFLQDYQVTGDDLVATLSRSLEPVRNYLANFVIAVGSSSLDLITNAIIFLALVGAALPNYSRLMHWLKKLSPLNDELDTKILSRITIMTVSMFQGVIVVAIAQGLVSGLLFLITGTPITLLLTLLAITAGIIPLGASIIAVPVGLYHLISGNYWQASVVLLGYFLIVSNIDNVIRPMLVSKETPLNSALVILSAFGGLSWFGLLGVIYGPVIMIILMTLVEIYKEHFPIIQIEPLQIEPVQVEVTTVLTPTTETVADS